MKNKRTMIFLFSIGMFSFLSTGLALADDSLANVSAGIGARTSCINALKGLGDASLVFESAVPKNYSKDNSMNNEFYWDAVLVTSTSSEINVRLHCARIKLPDMKGIRDKPVIRSYAELVIR